MRQTLATKRADVVTTSDQWRLAQSRPVTRQSPSGVKGGALETHLMNKMFQIKIDPIYIYSLVHIIMIKMS